MDREKVIKGIEHCLKESEHIHDNPCRGCPYEDIDSGVGSRCVDVLMSDALALLKEQEAVKPFHRCIGNEHTLIEDSHFDFCPYCGKPIDWEGR